jgi:hypothetical protein
MFSYYYAGDQIHTHTLVASSFGCGLISMTHILTSTKLSGRLLPGLIRKGSFATIKRLDSASLGEHGNIMVVRSVYVGNCEPAQKRKFGEEKMKLSRRETKLT